ncbi:type II toxin-antitoxin system death-on-curing family toxin [Paenibacillus eucommiae]|uniref:Death-on-curing protein n=1 Tax=Paenibacillus eucommiae TaxID=1355755 RepID=A0ABS4IWX8_9BACL|nr:type II toxin-antitoxin system death-on-curing family toxin [Paenibacillus eucommiae]MBP1992097.1 death-on-curing protein [Paenibacillus eucommiae]
MTIFLTKEEAVAAHYFLMKKMNDTEQAGVKEHALLDSAMHRAQQSVFGEDEYPTLFDKASALLESLVKNHCFHNGNKRTAYLVVKSFLLLNGFQLQMERQYAVEFIVDIAKGTHSLEAIASILKEYSVEK